MLCLGTLALICMKLAKGKAADSDKSVECSSWKEFEETKSAHIGHLSLGCRVRKFQLKYKKFTANEILCQPKDFLYEPEEDKTDLLIRDWDIKGVSLETIDGFF